MVKTHGQEHTFISHTIEIRQDNKIQRNTTETFALSLLESFMIQGARTNFAESFDKPVIPNTAMSTLNRKIAPLCSKMRSI